MQCYLMLHVETLAIPSCIYLSLPPSNLQYFIRGNFAILARRQDFDFINYNDYIRYDSLFLPFRIKIHFGHFASFKLLPPMAPFPENLKIVYVKLWLVTHT